MITIYSNIIIGEDVISLDYSRITSISSSIIDRGDTKLPSYGIISNSGDIIFRDSDSMFSNYAAQGLLSPDLKVQIYLKNTISNITQQIYEYETRNWSYDNNNKIVSVTIYDDLQEWQDISVDKIDYDIRDTSITNLRVFYDHFYSKTPSKYNMMEFEELTDETKYILENTFVNYKLLYSGNLWQQWTKLCQAAQAHIYKTGNGKTTFVYNGGY
jgi:hypothetical protein